MPVARSVTHSQKINKKHTSTFEIKNPPQFYTRQQIKNPKSKIPNHYLAFKKFIPIKNKARSLNPHPKNPKSTHAPSIKNHTSKIRNQKLPPRFKWFILLHSQ